MVRLVGEHLSNPEVAARLFVSRATVKTHLVHIFTKLGIDSRSELAAAAILIRRHRIGANKTRRACAKNFNLVSGQRSTRWSM